MDYCPICNSELVNIFYGYPSEAFIELAKQNQIAIGGPKKGDEIARYYCYECNESFK
jgi:hypothetical protein